MQNKFAIYNIETKFLTYFKESWYPAFGSENPLYHALLTYLLYKSEAINRASYFARLKVIKRGYTKQQSDRNSKLVGWQSDITKQELLEMEVEKCASKNVKLASIEVLQQVILDLGYKNIVKKKHARKEAEYQWSQYITDGIFNSYYDYYTYDDLRKIHSELTDLGYSIHLPYEGQFEDGYCCRDCDGCLGRYKGSRMYWTVNDWKKEVEKQNKLK